MRFLCVGSAHWDVIARAGAIPRPGDDVPGSVEWRPGGVALNIAVGLARRGGAVGLCAALGDDFAGAALLRQIAALGVETSCVVEIEGAATDAYVAIEDGAGELVAAVAASKTLEAHAEAVVARAAAALREASAGSMILEANLPQAAIVALAQAARAAGWRLVLNPVSPAKAPRLAPALAPDFRATVATNLAEARALTGLAEMDAAQAATALRDCGALAALVTDGPRKAALATEAGLVEATPLAAAGSVTGAGDALLAGYLACEDPLADPEAALSAALDAAARHMTKGSE